MPCSVTVGYQHCGGPHCLHLHCEPCGPQLESSYIHYSYFLMGNCYRNCTM